MQLDNNPQYTGCLKPGFSFCFIAKTSTVLDNPSHSLDIRYFQIKAYSWPFNLIIVFELKFDILRYRANVSEDVSLY